MKQLLELKINVYKYTLLLVFIIAVASFFIVSDYKALLYGLAFGTLIAILNFNLLANTMEKAVQMNPERAQVYASSRYFLRFVIYGVVLYISILAEYINVFGTIIGLLSVKLVILMMYLFNDKAYYINIFKKR